MAAQPKPYTPKQERFGTGFIRVASTVNAWLYRRSKGRIGGRFPGGAPICLLTTRGRKSGQDRTVALLYLRDGDDVVVVASKGGMSQHPEWYLNLVADPTVRIEIGTETLTCTARTATDAEKQSLWPRLVAMYKSYDTYQARTERPIPVVICTPVG